MKHLTTVMKAASARRAIAAAGLTTALAAVMPMAHAADWSTTNIQLLYGTNYADDFSIDDEKKTVMTFEHANGWKYGDNFFFVDISNPGARRTRHYAEFSPRLSFGKMTGKELKFGIVKDVLLSGTMEMGDGVNAFLAGAAVALDLPGFAFADFNLYWRTSHRDFVAEQSDAGAQITIDWLVPFQIGAAKLAFEGFADYAWGETGGSAPKADNLVAGPRLLVDLGNFWGTPNHLQAGIEYQIWRNKFGIDGIDEDVAQAMVKWTF